VVRASVIIFILCLWQGVNKYRPQAMV